MVKKKKSVRILEISGFCDVSVLRSLSSNKRLEEVVWIFVCGGCTMLEKTHVDDKYGLYVKEQKAMKAPPKSFSFKMQPYLEFWKITISEMTKKPSNNS